MDFVRSYFGTSEPLISGTHSKPVKEWEKKCSTGQRFTCTEVTSYKIHILGTTLATDKKNWPQIILASLTKIMKGPDKNWAQF